MSRPAASTVALLVVISGMAAAQRCPSQDLEVMADIFELHHADQRALVFWPRVIGTGDGDILDDAAELESWARESISVSVDPSRNGSADASTRSDRRKKKHTEVQGRTGLR